MTSLRGALWLGLSIAVAARAQQPEKPLPAVKDLQARALAGFDKAVELRQKYLCREVATEHEYDGKGRVKEANTYEREVFFVNRTQIAQTIAKNGKPLSPEDVKKRDEAVRKAVEQAQKNKPPAHGNAFSVRDVLKYGRLVNERRVEVAGRPTIVFDLQPDPDKGGSIEEKIIHALDGTISIDEATGTVQDVNAEGKRDVKIGGGLVANVHKGFRVHVILAPQPDGVWMMKLVEGKGDARIGLFVTRGGDFHDETRDCKLFSATAESIDKLEKTP